MFKGARIFAEMLSIFNLYRKLSAEVWRGTFYVESQSQAVNHPPTRRGRLVQFWRTRIFSFPPSSPSVLVDSWNAIARKGFLPPFVFLKPPLKIAKNIWFPKSFYRNVIVTDLTWIEPLVRSNNVINFGEKLNFLESIVSQTGSKKQ